MLRVARGAVILVDCQARCGAIFGNSEDAMQSWVLPGRGCLTVGGLHVAASASGFFEVDAR